MSFWGSEFIYRGRSSREFGVMMYSFGRGGSSSHKFTSAGRMSEDIVARRYSTLRYGISANDPQTFTLSFGPTMDRINSHIPFDRYEIEKIAAWLTGWPHDDWLYIVQPDMEEFRYRCVINDLQLSYQSEEAWNFEASVYCDSPFGYTREKTYEYAIQGTREIDFFNRSTYNGYYRPKITMDFNPGAGSLVIVNNTDGGRTFSLTPPTTGISVEVDNQNEIITDKTNGLNLYTYFNFNYLRLVRGSNSLSVTTDGLLKIICSFPVNIGG